MLDYFLQCGVWGYPLFAITIAIDVLIIINITRIVRGGTTDELRFYNSINSILFWGAFSAVMGFLGQYTGIYIALGAIINAAEISPKMVMTGFRESFTTTLWGLNNLLGAAVAWAALRFWYRKVTPQATRPAV
jgi:hypothetical protein